MGIGRVSLINDFAAIGYGVLGLKSADIYTMQAGEVDEKAPIAVIGAGTGLGEAFLINQGSNPRIFATEGGHTDFAPRNELEFQLLEYLKKKYNVGRIFRGTSSFRSGNCGNKSVFCASIPKR